MAKKLLIEIFLMAGIGLVLGLFGPFGTFAMEAGPRIAYWLVFILAGYAIFRPLIVVGQWLSDTLSIPGIVGVGLALVIASLPMTLLVANLLSGFDVTAALRWPGLPLLYFQVWLIGFLINGLFRLLFDKAATIAVPEQAMPMKAAEPLFLSRLPPGFGPLLALRGEDHYVRAIGEKRDEMLLMRLRDAVAELDGAEGIVVHRSWWVARTAVKSVERDGRALTLILVSGHDVPVARDKAPLLRKAGWLQ